MKNSINIKAVGDIAFVGEYAEIPNEKVLQNVKSILMNSDLVIGNLESALTHENEGIIGKCNLRSHPGWAKYLKDSGINFVSLANNHIMDFGEQGLLETIDSLKKNNIRFIGAGENIDDANAPYFLEMKNQKIAILARSSVIVSSPINAQKDKAGIAFFDKEEIISNINNCKKKSDLVTLILHWGLEEYVYPSPSQRILAKELIQNGVDIIIGHHPHVLQGVEKYNHSFIAYSLGNFLFNDFKWIYRKNGEDDKTMRINLSSQNRFGLILNIEYDNKQIVSAEKYFTNIDQNGIINLSKAQESIKNFNILSRRLQYPFYTLLWKLYALRMEWNLRLKNRYGIKNISKKFFKIRPQHLKELLNSLKKTSGITSEKTTNPYE